MAVTDQSEAIWKAIRARLIADTGIRAILGSDYANRVVRRALPGESLPCILCTAMESTDRGTDDSDAETVRIELHIWAKAGHLVSGENAGAALKALVKSSLHWSATALRTTVERVSGPLPDPQPDLLHFVIVIEAISEHVDL